MPTTFSDSTIAVPGGHVFARRWDPAQHDLAPIVLLHDSLGSIDLWRDFPAALADAAARPVIAYDRLGFGRSTPRTQRPDANFIAQEADVYFPAIAAALGISRFALFGHSVGGAMALTIAARQPRQCEAVVTESAQAFVEARTLAGIEAARKNFAAPEPFAKLVKLHGEKARWVLEAWTEVWLSPAFASWSLDADLGDVRCPVLAIHGDRDEFGSEAFPRRITEGVRGPARLELLADCGHVPHREQRDAVLRLTSSFLDRCNDAAALA